MSDSCETVVDASGLESSRANLTAFIVCLGCVVVLLDVSIVNVALQRIANGLGGRVSDLQWIVDAYTLAFASFLLTGGTAGDRYGNKQVFGAGVVLFTLASVFCGTANTLAVLIFARVIQGIGAALIIPCSLTLLNHAFDDAAQRAKAFGWWAGSGGVAVAGGPLIGGLLVNWFGWRSIFFVNLPIGIVALLLTIRFIREEKPLPGRRIDLGGQIVSLFALAALTAVLIEGSNWGWLSLSIIGLSLAFVLLSLPFVWIEARQPDPMLPLKLFRSPQFSVATSLGLLLSFPFYGLIFTLSLYFQHTSHGFANGDERIRGAVGSKAGSALPDCCRACHWGSWIFLARIRGACRRRLCRRLVSVIEHWSGRAAYPSASDVGGASFGRSTPGWSGFCNPERWPPGWCSCWSRGLRFIGFVRS
jgi:MFS family permease